MVIDEGLNGVLMLKCGVIVHVLRFRDTLMIDRTHLYIIIVSFDFFISTTHTQSTLHHVF